MQKDYSMPGTALGMSLTSSYFAHIDFKESINVRWHYYFCFTDEGTELSLIMCAFILFTC